MKTLTLTILSALTILGLQRFAVGENDAAIQGNAIIHCQLEMDRSVLAANKLQRAVVMARLNSTAPAQATLPRVPVNLCLVLDRSGSMSGEKMNQAKEAAIRAVEHLGAQDKFSMVTYDHQAQLTIAAQSPKGNGKTIARAIRAVEPGGGSSMFGGISLGAAEIRKSDDQDYINRIIVLSDGMANEGPSSAAELGRLGTALFKEGISVSTIGIGDEFNEDLMTALAENSGGNAWFVESVKDLPAIFDAELDDVLSVVAKNVMLEIQCEAGVHPVRIVGREGRINENRVLIQMNQLYAGQEKFVLIEVEITPQKAETERALLQARLQYSTSKATEQVVIQTKPLTSRFSDSPEAVLASGNPRVQRDFNYANLAAAKDQAIEYYELGEPEEAFKVLLLNAVEANAWAAENGDAALAKEANDLNKGNLYLQQEGLDNTLRKNWRIQSFQTRGGQKAVAQSPGQFDQNLQQINDEESQQTLDQSDKVTFPQVGSKKQNAQPKSEKQKEGARY